MNVTIKTGDLFKADAQTLVNAVNCVGVMGKGIALAFKQRFPVMFADYAERCKRGDVRLGQPYLYRQPHPPHILNFPTKNHWRSTSKLDGIVEGLDFLLEHYTAWGIESLAVPALGCGLGGLAWADVAPVLHRYLSQMTIPVILFAPPGTPDNELQITP